MSENQGGTINLLPQTEQKKNGLNGKNGTNGSKSMGAESIYFKVAIPKQIIKRDGRIVSFDAGRIQVALERCFSSLANPPKTSVEDLTQQVVNVVAAKYDLPTVEGVQDIVEMALQAAGEYLSLIHVSEPTRPY